MGVRCGRKFVDGSLLTEVVDESCGPGGGGGELEYEKGRGARQAGLP